MAKSFTKQFEKRYFRLPEVAKIVGVKDTRLRYWEKQINFAPLMRQKIRYYTGSDITLFKKLKQLIDEEHLKPLAAFNKLNGYTASLNDKPNGRASHIDLEDAYTIDFVMEVCRVSEKTARRYLSNNRMPHSAATLLKLTKHGRILPESWDYCFFNHKDNLEIYQVGEVRENDVLNIHWARQLYASHVRELEYQYKKAKERIIKLETEIENLHCQQGKLPAANDPLK